MALLLALVIANVADVAATAAGIIQSGGNVALEANPLGRIAWDAGGTIGLILAKAIPVAVVWAAAETAGMAGRPNVRLFLYAVGMLVPLLGAATWAFDWSAVLDRDISIRAILTTE